MQICSKKPIKPGQAWKTFTVICRDVGLSGNFGTHSLRKTWGYHARMQGVDTVPNIVGLEERGFKAYLPTPDLSKRSDYYTSDQFHYDAESDQYIYPQIYILPLWSRLNSEENFYYRFEYLISIFPMAWSICKDTTLSKSQEPD
jgi:hypothetical protein